MLVLTYLLFPQCFSTFLQENPVILDTSKVSSANPFNLNECNILSFGKKLSDISAVRKKKPRSKFESV